MLIPFDIVYLIRDYLPWKYRVQLVSKDWLNGALRKRVRIHKWKSKVLVFSYMRTFGPYYTRRSWHSMCISLHLYRRARNKHFRLTWKAATEQFFEKQCKGCGCHTRANVFGWPICTKCRRNDSLKECYMVSVGTAVSMGIPKRILRTIPYHYSGRGQHLRFWKDIQEKL
jgi:hypothetical protein